MASFHAGRVTCTLECADALQTSPSCVPVGRRRQTRHGDAATIAYHARTPVLTEGVVSWQPSHERLPPHTERHGDDQCDQPDDNGAPALARRRLTRSVARDDDPQIDRERQHVVGTPTQRRPSGRPAAPGTAPRTAWLDRYRRTGSPARRRPWLCGGSRARARGLWPPGAGGAVPPARRAPARRAGLGPQRRRPGGYGGGGRGIGHPLPTNHIFECPCGGGNPRQHPTAVIANLPAEGNHFAYRLVADSAERQGLVQRLYRVIEGEAADQV